MKKLSSAGELVTVGNAYKIGMNLLHEICLRKADLDMEEEIKHMEKLKTRLMILKSYLVLTI